MAKSKIEWTDRVWNPVTGCTKISPGCQNCYAERMAKRLAGRCGYPKDEPFRVTLHPERLEEPLRWKKPSRVFVSSIGDLFHEKVHPYDIMRIFNVMAQAKQHTFMVLTKKPENLLAFYKRLRPGVTIPGPYFSICGKGQGYAGSPPRLPDNIWIGVTAENQEQADKRIPVLLQIPAAVRFVSCEPLLGAVDLEPWMILNRFEVTDDILDAPDGALWGRFERVGDYWEPVMPRIDWVICGGESGPGARPMHPDWVRSLRDQCQAEAAGVPFFFKQWGEWLPCAVPRMGINEYLIMTPDGKTIPGGWPEAMATTGDTWAIAKVGKKKASRLLDGQTWDEIPGVAG